MDLAGFGQRTQNRRDAAGARHVLHVIHVGRRGQLADAGHLARQPIDILHREVHPRFLRHRQKVQHRIRGAAHGDVQRHRVLERLEAGNAARQHRGVPLHVVGLGHLKEGNLLQVRPFDRCGSELVV